MTISPALFLLGVPTEHTGFLASGNDPIVITSDDAPSVNTGDTAVVTVTTTGGTGDIDFAIVGGADAGAFTIDDESGALAFTAASVDGTYEVIVRAFSDWGSADQTITVTVAAGGYHADAVHFDAFTQLESDGLIISDSRLGLISLWTRPAVVSNLGGTLFNTLDGGFWAISVIRTNSDTDLSIICDFWDTTNSVDFAFNATIPLPGLPNWVNILIAVDTNHPAGQKVGLITVNRTSLIVTVAADSAPAFDIGWSQDPTTTVFRAQGAAAEDYAEVYAALGQYADVSDTAVMDKFSDSGGKPVDLGSDGSLPTGTAPTIFFSGDATGFLTNRGTGGTFTKTGTVTNAGSSPSD